MGLVAYITEGLVTLLPDGYRGWYAPDEDLYPAAAVCGVVQYALCAGLFLVRFIAFMQGSMASVGAGAVARHQEVALAGVQYHIGMVYSTAYLLSPLTLLLAYLVWEGLVRFLAATVTREVLGTAPLAFLAWAWRRAGASALPRPEFRRPRPQSLR